MFAGTAPSSKLRSLAGSDPAAGANVLETVPANVRRRLIALRVAFVTDATVATRVVDIVIDDGTTVVLELSAVATQAASQTFTYQAAAAGVAPNNGANQILIPIPEGLYLGPGYRIKTAVNNLQAGDNFGAPQMLVEEWNEGPTGQIG